jgi:hypothetical protein
VTRSSLHTSFFRYCHLNCHKDHPDPKTSSTPPPRTRPRPLVSAFSSPSKVPIALPPPGQAGIGAGQQPFISQQNGVQLTLQQQEAQLQQQNNAVQAAANKPEPILPTVGRAVNEEIEVISDYSWRNFFSTINFIKILQKMTKHRTHRTYMLNQYKSSVSPLLRQS